MTRNLSDIPDIKDFMHSQNISRIPEESISNEEFIPYIETEIEQGKKYTINTFGCQMNENDTQIIHSILQKSGFIYEPNQEEAEVILFNTCAIRESAESKIWLKLSELRAQRKRDKKQVITGVLGCMAERLKEKLVEQNKVVDLIAGPDAYRDLPRLISEISPKKYQINVQLSLDETYADITPVRINEDSKQAFVSIMRGCNNMCAFCIVPFTRGRERSRSMQSIIEEVRHLESQNVKEITLLGQNVNSYFDCIEPPKFIGKKTHQQIQIEQEDIDNNKQSNFDTLHENSDGFNENYKLREGQGPRFADLLEALAKEFPEMRIRFTSPHPKDFPDSVLETIKTYPNICKNIHMPAQHGNTEMLKRMRRNHTKEAYIKLVTHIKQKIPGITLSSDFIAGFCGETEQEFQDTLELLEYVKYEQAFLFAYSMREKTHAYRKYKDDVPEDVKLQRLQQMIDLYHKNQGIVTQQEIGRFHIVLIDGIGKKEGQLKGRTDTNRICIIEQKDCQKLLNEQQVKICRDNFFQKQNQDIFEQLVGVENKEQKETMENGDYVLVYVTDVTQRSLFCTPIAKTSISQFSDLSLNRPFVQPNFFKD